MRARRIGEDGDVATSVAGPGVLTRINWFKDALRDKAAIFSEPPAKADEAPFSQSEEFQAARAALVDDYFLFGLISRQSAERDLALVSGIETLLHTLSQRQVFRLWLGILAYPAAALAPETRGLYLRLADYARTLLAPEKTLAGLPDDHGMFRDFGEDAALIGTAFGRRFHVPSGAREAVGESLTRLRSLLAVLPTGVRSELAAQLILNTPPAGSEEDAAQMESFLADAVAAADSGVVLKRLFERDRRQNADKAMNVLRYVQAHAESISEDQLRSAAEGLASFLANPDAPVRERYRAVIGDFFSALVPEKKYVMCCAVMTALTGMPEATRNDTLSYLRDLNRQLPEEHKLNLLLAWTAGSTGIADDAAQKFFETFFTEILATVNERGTALRGLIGRLTPETGALNLALLRFLRDHWKDWESEAGQGVFEEIGKRIGVTFGSDPKAYGGYDHGNRFGRMIEGIRLQGLATKLKSAGYFDSQKTPAERREILLSLHGELRADFEGVHEGYRHSIVNERFLEAGDDDLTMRVILFFLMGGPRSNPAVLDGFLFCHDLKTFVHATLGAPRTYAHEIEGRKITEETWEKLFPSGRDLEREKSAAFQKDIETFLASAASDFSVNLRSNTYVSDGGKKYDTDLSIGGERVEVWHWTHYGQNEFGVGHKLYYGTGTDSLGVAEALYAEKLPSLDFLAERGWRLSDEPPPRLKDRVRLAKSPDGTEEIRLVLVNSQGSSWVDVKYRKDLRGKLARWAAALKKALGLG